MEYEPVTYNNDGTGHCCICGNNC